VAARSYTLFYRGRRGSEGFDLFGTVEDQVYGPVESERPLASGCVARTRGEVALYAGQPIRANYCSTCGGISAAVWEAWPAGPIPYLESRRDTEEGRDLCSGSPVYRWQERWSAEEFLGDIARFGPAQGLRLPATGTGRLLDVRVVARSRSGRVWRLRVLTTTLDLAIPAYAVRATVRRGGHAEAILRSGLFKIDVRRGPDGRALEVVASGAGAGHGVGLCQTGALGLARAGAKAERILAHYYPGAEVHRLY
jgi:stage II sporulation protein D